MKSASRSSSTLSLALAGSLVCGAGLLLPSEVSAFCGFYVAGADAKLYNNATIVVLMREGTRTVLSMRNSYQGPPEAFALVIPVPVVLQEGDVKTLRDELFDRVDTLASPRLVEYWEADPCAANELGEAGLIGRGSGSGTGGGFGGRGGGESVKIEAEFAVGEYDIVILSATESSGLDTWLRDNKYNIPAGAEPLLRPYVAQGMKFFVAKVDPQKVVLDANGRVELSPLRFHYDSPDFTLPVRLGLINAPDPSSGGKQDLLIHILAPRLRYEVANYPNVTIPTNLDVSEVAKERFGEFYVSLLDHTLAQTPGAVVTEYAWMAGNCDPCPVENAGLTQQDLLEFGGDVLPERAEGLSTMTANVPMVRQGKATVGAGLDSDIVRRVVRAHINEVRSCYNAGLVRSNALGGQVVIDFTISTDGKVEAAAVSSSTLSDPEVGECVARMAKRWLFPKPTGANSVAVSYPFVLSGNVGPFAATDFVLTRLHARYDATSLGEDLVFEAAPPIIGGRELADQDGALEQGATILGQRETNNFQARYAIRHPWTGPIACQNPRRGIWAGPPQGGPQQPKVARQLADVTRGVSLASFLSKGSSEQIGVVTDTPAPAPIAGTDTPAAAPISESSTGPAPASGCACTSASPPPPGVAWIGLFALLGLRRPSRRRSPN